MVDLFSNKLFKDIHKRSKFLYLKCILASFMALMVSLGGHVYEPDGAKTYFLIMKVWILYHELGLWNVLKRKPAKDPFLYL